MKATAAYHELAATRLHCAGLVVSVVNPAQARSLDKGWGMLSKTDMIDALLLAQSLGWPSCGRGIRWQLTSRQSKREADAFGLPGGGRSTREEPP